MAKGDTKGDTKGAVPAEAQKVHDQEREDGFRGTKVDPLPNERYSQEGGADDQADSVEARKAAAEALEA